MIPEEKYKRESRQRLHDLICAKQTPQPTEGVKRIGTGIRMSQETFDALTIDPLEPLRAMGRQMTPEQFEALLQAIYEVEEDVGESEGA